MRDEFVATPAGVRLCFRDHGDPTHPAFLLIAGLGEDLQSWGADFVAALVAHQFRVITMENRDVGRSSFIATPPPALWRQIGAWPRHDAYTLEEMAGDVRAVLDHCQIARVHLLGRSMGGMIAQCVAASDVDRILTLTSLYSTTGSRRVGQPAWSTIALLCAPAARDQAAFVRAHVRLTQHVSGTAYPIDVSVESQLAADAWSRCEGDGAAGAARQIQAIQASGDRTAQLQRIQAPTLVIHGERDRLVAPSGGLATAQAIPHARYVVVPGMGHHLHQALVNPITQLVVRHAMSPSAKEPADVSVIP